MPMHAIGITKQVSLPHAEGEWIEICRLSGKKLKAARKARKHAGYAEMRELGSDLLKVLADRCSKCGENKHEGDCAEPEQREDASGADPTEEYDTDVLLHAGIVAWSSDLKVTKDNIDELDEPTVVLVKREIVAYNTSPTEEEQAKATGLSSSS